MDPMTFFFSFSLLHLALDSGLSVLESVCEGLVYLEYFEPSIGFFKLVISLLKQSLFV